MTFHAAFGAPEIPIAGCGWDFGDGTSSSELDVANSYTKPGKYTATFTAVDEMGGSDEARWLATGNLRARAIEVALPPRHSAYSDEIVHPFRRKASTRSGSNRPAVPVEIVRLFQAKSSTCSGSKNPVVSASPVDQVGAKRRAA